MISDYYTVLCEVLWAVQSTLNVTVEWFSGGDHLCVKVKKVIELLFILDQCFRQVLHVIIPWVDRFAQEQNIKVTREADERSNNKLNDAILRRHILFQNQMGLCDV